MHLSVADIANLDLLSCVCRIWIRFDIAGIYEEQPAGPHGRLAQKTINRASISGGGRCRHTAVCETAVIAPPRIGCDVWIHWFSIC